VRPSAVGPRQYDEGMRTRGLASLAWGSLQDLFDQSTAFGRLALVHVVMMAGDTMVTVSLAGSLFFSVSPTEAKSKVLLYLVFTIAPFAVVSPLLGPLIDRSVNGRRVLVAASALARALLCWSMAQHLNSLWLFPEAFAVIICSKFYTVTRGALVPEMARTDQLRRHAVGLSDSGWPETVPTDTKGFSGFNAQLTLLGTFSGVVAGSVGAAILKGLGASSVLGVDTVIFAGATLCALRLKRPTLTTRDHTLRMTQEERDRLALNPLGDREVTWGLGASALMRFAVGFGTFLMAFGLRRAHASLTWYGLGLGLSAVGSLLGLGLVTRLRQRLTEATMLTAALVVTGVAAGIVARHASTVAQCVLAGVLGVCASVAQPSFDAITQRLVPAGAQGRTFARFAVRQQLTWVLGAVLPVGVALSFQDGDRFLCVVLLSGAVTYGLGRRRATRDPVDQPAITER